MIAKSILWVVFHVYALCSYKYLFSKNLTALFNTTGMITKSSNFTKWDSTFLLGLHLPRSTKIIFCFRGFLWNTEKNIKTVFVCTHSTGRLYYVTLSLKAKTIAVDFTQNWNKILSDDSIPTSALSVFWSGRMCLRTS